MKVLWWLNTWQIWSGKTPRTSLRQHMKICYHWLSGSASNDTALSVRHRYGGWCHKLQDQSAPYCNLVCMRRRREACLLVDTWVMISDVFWSLEVRSTCPSNQQRFSTAISASCWRRVAVSDPVRFTIGFIRHVPKLFSREPRCPSGQRKDVGRIQHWITDSIE